MKIVTVEQMREIERRSAAAGVSAAELMENAGRAVGCEAQRRLQQTDGKRVLVLVGPGNNGGDGLVAARHLHDAGAQVSLCLWSRDVAHDKHYEATQQRGIPALRASDDTSMFALRHQLAEADLIVDALLGTGRGRPASGLLKQILEATNRERRAESTLVAVDLPTGLDADTGAVDESCLRADLTVTLGFPKVGLFAFPGATMLGRLEVGDIGLPQHVADDVALELTTADEVARLLPKRPIDAHKGTFGKVVVVGGSPNYVGAPTLAAQAAGRVGAGLVTLACASALHPIFAAKLTEVTFEPLPEAAPGVLGTTSIAPLLRSLAGYNVLLIGPGLGRQDATSQFVRGTLAGLRNAVSGPQSVGPAHDTMSCVVDADALNALAGSGEWWKALPPNAVFTPHSGEMARLLQIAVEDVNADRLEKARAAAATWGVVIILKGAFTIIAAPDGRANIQPSANPALATAGTGDVLAGAIAGLLAQRLPPFAAAVTGVYLHAQAGEMARASFGNAGVLAGDLLSLLPRALMEVKR